MGDGEAFCSSCGSSTGSPCNPRNINYTERNTGLTVLLSLIWIGAGHLYVGKIGKGIGIMVGGIFLAYLGLVMLVFSLIIGIIMIIVMLVLYIWSVFDAYGLAKEYNSALVHTGNPPW